MLARLEKEGMLDKTLVVFMTDHGISHARGKQFLYDEGTHVPFVVRGPGIAKGDVRDDLIEHIDLAAIVAGARPASPIPKAMQGRNVLAKDYQPRDAVFAARDRCDETVERIRSVRTDRFKYIRNFHPAAARTCSRTRYKDGKTHRADAPRSCTPPASSTRLQRSCSSRPTRPPEELYDWTTDPFEVRNLAADPAHAADARRRCAAGSTAG